MIEVNTITPLLEDYGIHGGYIKVVGTSFKNRSSSLPRHVTVRGFFERNASKSTYSSDLWGLVKDVDVRIIKEIEDIQIDVNRYVRVERELENSYDPNAIAVHVESSYQFTKIGYLPKDLSELIVTNEFKWYVVGFEKSGRGMLLTMIFNSPDISFIEVDPIVPSPEKNKSLSFMSLNKVRKTLCIR